MHGMKHKSEAAGAPEDTSAILHQASQYDLHSGLLGFGPRGSNSKMVVEIAQIKQGESVLDVGCGSGSLALAAAFIAGPAAKVCGIDASAEMIEVARKKAAHMAPQVVFNLDRIEKLTFPDASFDVVISRLVIHHLPDELKRKGFAEMLRVLKPGGRLLIADFAPPANPFWAHVALALVGHRMMQSDVSAIPPMLEEAGFADIGSGRTRSVFLAYVSGRKPVTG